MEILKIKDQEGNWQSIPAIKGDAGYTPVKGKDYWTEEDQAAIIAEVLAALPSSEEVGY